MSKNILVAICTAIVGVTIGASNETLGLIFPYPSTFGLILTILANAFLLNTAYKKFMLIYAICAVLVYPFALFANMIFLVGMMAKSKRKIIFFFSILLSVLIFLVLLQFGGYHYGSIGGTKFSTGLVLSLLSYSYAGEKGLLLFVLGLFFIFINKSFDRRYVVVLISMGVLFSVMISGLYFVAYRLEEFMRPFVALISGYGLGSFSIYLGSTIYERMFKKSNGTS
jgi:hypothetical protein